MYAHVRMSAMSPDRVGRSARAGGRARLAGVAPSREPGCGRVRLHRPVGDLDLATGPAAEGGQARPVEPLAGPVPVDRDDVAGHDVIDEAGPVDPAPDPLDAGWRETELALRHLERHGRDHEPVAVALEDAAPADPARIHDLEGPIGLPGPHEPEAREDVEDVEGVDGHRAGPR